MNEQEMTNKGETLVTDNSPLSEETPTQPGGAPAQSEETPAQPEGTTIQSEETPAQQGGTPVPTTQDITQITEGLKQIVVALQQVADNLEKTTRKSEQIDVLKKKRKNLWWKKFWTIIGVIICVFVLGGLQFILLQKFGKVTDNNNSLTIWSWIVVAVTVVMQLLIVCIQISKFNKYSQIINKLDLLIMKVCLVPTSSSIEIERELQLITRLWDNKKSILDVFIKN